MGNKKNVKLTKLEKTKATKTKQVATKAQATFVVVQYLGSFIPTFLDDVFFTHVWLQMFNQVDNGLKGLLVKLQDWGLISKAWCELTKTIVVWLTLMVSQCDVAAYALSR